MSWTTSQLCLGLTVFFSVAIQSGFSIMCWECNSEYDKRCGDPFDNHTFAPTDCSQKFLTHYPEVPAVVCRKIIQKVKGEYRYIRACGFLEEERGGRQCFRRAGTFDVQIEYCQCKSDKCNEAHTLSGHVLVTILASVILVVRHLRWDLSYVLN